MVAEILPCSFWKVYGSPDGLLQLILVFMSQRVMKSEEAPSWR
jgi:hypothetical protein